MKCPRCQFEHAASRSFCGQCGARLATACPQCGAENPDLFCFCGECGTRLRSSATTEDSATAAAPAAAGPGRGGPTRSTPPHGYTPPHLTAEVLQSQSALEGERKQVTVLFCDLVGSTALADRVGAETMHTLLNQFFELALAEVHRYEGTINQFLGDGFMALFGAPIAHEDHARRAVLAALGLRQRLEDRRAELGRKHGAELKLRMGLNTGQVVVGGIGDHLRMDYTAVGDTTNLAARLQSLASPGDILVSQATSRRILRFFRMEAMEPSRVKGKAEPIQPYRVLEEIRRPAERPVTHRALSPFVGRDRELAILEECWQQAAAGQGQVVGISGEAGSGKSRLILELRQRLKSSSVTYLIGRCLSYGSGIPYLPLAHMLRTAGGISEIDPPDVVTEKLRTNLLQLGVDTQEPLPFLLHLLGIREGTQAAELEPRALHGRIFATLRQILLRASELRPVVLEIEDLQWIDATSEEFLDSLLEMLAGARLMVLLTYRSGYRPGWMDKSFATQIPMRRLSTEESGAIVSTILERIGLPGELGRSLLEKAEGNPFFLEELAWSMAEQSDGETAVPDTVQEVLMARIDRLPEEHKRLLQTASVLGREFSRRLLAALWEPPETLEPLLADLKRWELVYQSPSVESPVYYFHHALTQDVAYQSLLTARRQALHAAAGRALESLYAENLADAYDRLAQHFPRANLPGKAVTYLTLFAEKAARNYAHAEAVRALKDALAQVRHLPAEERDRRQVEVVLRLADSLLPLARLRESLELLEQSADSVERLAEPSLTGPYHFWLALNHSYLGNPEGATRCARLALAEAEACDDKVTEGQARYVLSRDSFWAGRFSEGLHDGLRAAELLERCGELWWHGQALWVNGFHHFVSGQFEAALEAMGRAREIGEALGGDPRLDTSWSTGYFLAAMGDPEAGIAECKGGFERARDPLNASAALGFLGYAYLEHGEVELATETLEQAVTRLEASGMQQLLGWFATYLGEAYLQAGRLEEAHASVLRSLQIHRKSRFLFGLALAKRARGRTRLGLGEPAEAQGAFFEAFGDFSALGVPFEAARTRWDLARIAHLDGQVSTAAQHLEEARRSFERLGARRHVERTRQLARELGVESLPAAQPS